MTVVCNRGLGMVWYVGLVVLGMIAIAKLIENLWDEE